MLHIHKQCFDRHNLLLLGKSRKKRSRPYPKSVVMWGQSEGERWTLSGGRHRQKRSASLNTSAEEIVARWLPEAPSCQGLLIFFYQMWFFEKLLVYSQLFLIRTFRWFVQILSLFSLSISFKLLDRNPISSTYAFRPTSSGVLLLPRNPQHNNGQEWACALQLFPAPCHR